MNKDEMIEQMAKDLVDEIEFDITFYDFNGSVGIHFDYDCTAKNVVEKGYRKVAEDEIVIKKDEYAELLASRLFNDVDEETAREILTTIYNNLKYATFQQTVALRSVKDLANEYGIELE